MNPEVIPFVIWFGVAFSLWIGISYEAGKDPWSGIGPLSFLMAAFWPVVIAMLLLMSPFLIARSIGERHGEANSPIPPKGDRP